LGQAGGRRAPRRPGSWPGAALAWLAL